MLPIESMRTQINSFNTYLRGKFGRRVQKISVDAGFNCPNLDGTLSKNGCIYCNNKAFGVYAGSGKSITEQIASSIEFYKKRMKVDNFIAYFQSFTNTYSDLKRLKENYDAIKKSPEIVGLFISTRPDCIDEEKLQLIVGYKKKYLVWIEYGLQTTHNRLLKVIKRNHTYEDFLNALALTRKYDINVGVHLILGLPSETRHDVIEDARRISSLDIQGVKFHVLHVLRGTKLEKYYQKGKIKLLGKKEYIGMICDFLEIVPPDLVILRLVSDAPSEYLVAPAWINQKVKVIEEINQELRRRGRFQGFLADSLVSG